LRKSVLRDFFLFFLPFIICFTFLFFLSQFSRIVSAKVTSLITEMAGPDFSLGGLSISSARGIRLERVKVHNAFGFDFSADAVTFKYSWQHLWPVKLAIKNIVMAEVKIDQWAETRRFSLKEIRNFKNRRFKFWGGLEVVLNEAVFCFENFYLDISLPLDKQASRELTIDFCLDGRDQKISFDGKISPDGGFLATPCHFSGHFDPVGKDLLVDASVDYTEYHFSGSGIISDFLGQPQADIKFHSQPISLDYYRWFKTVKTKEGQVSFLGHLTGPLNDLNVKMEFIIPSTEIALEKDTLGLDHISGLINYRLRDKIFYIKQIKAAVDNNFAINISGKIEHIFSPKLELRCQMQYLEQSSKQYDWAVEFQGQSSENRLAGSAQLIWLGAESRQYVCLLKDMSMQKKDPLSAKSDFVVTAKGLEFIEQIIRDNKELPLQKLFFDQLALEVNFLGKRTLIEQLTVDGYGGRVSAQGNFYFNEKEREYMMDFNLNKIDFKDIEVFYPVYAEVSGIISGQVSASHHKGGQVKGVLTAERFRLTHFNPLDKIADFLGLSTMKEIIDAQIVVDFDLSAQESIIEQFDFDSESLQMRSHFNVSKGRWLEGVVALSMPRVTLAESKIFKRLMAIAREREEKLDFLVRVSGYADSLRTELIESTLRDTLKERLSTRIQKYIEEKINKAMESQRN